MCWIPFALACSIFLATVDFFIKLALFKITNLPFIQYEKTSDCVYPVLADILAIRRIPALAMSQCRAVDVCAGGEERSEHVPMSKTAGS
jgi:hypothetical protein